MRTVILNGLEWMTENLTGHGGTEIDGNWYYTWEQAMKAAEEIGDGWRLPTQREFEKLCDLGSTWDAVKKGRLFGGKLFLESDGFFRNDFEKIECVGSYGYYWSSSPYYDNHYMGGLYFGSIGVGPIGSNHRAYGFSVRCVRDIKKEKPKTVYALFNGYGSRPLIGVFSTYEKAEEAKKALDKTKNCPHFITETKMDGFFLK